MAGRGPAGALPGGRPVLAITYLSSATALLRADALLELLATSRARNEQAGVTGVLLYADGNFIQTIEGPDEVVEDAFARIQADPRHRGVLEVWREEITERAFPDWSMGFRELSAAEVEHLPGFSSYLRGRGEQLVQDAGAFTPAAFFRIFRDGSRGVPPGRDRRDG